MKQKEEKCCGECCWFCHEDADGFGICYQDNKPVGDIFGCSHVCHNNAFVSRERMRHYQAVLLQYHRWLKDWITVKRICPDKIELEEAAGFAYKYMKVFSNL